MKKISYKDKTYNKEEELKFVINSYIFPLLGMYDNNLLFISKKDFLNLDEKLRHNKIFYYNNKIFFVPYTDKPLGCYINVSKKYSNVNFNLVNVVLKCLLDVFYNDINSSSKMKNIYGSFNQCLVNYDYAVQHAICSYLNGDGDENRINDLLQKLEWWSSKTYEGKKVPFGFIICKNVKGDNGINYIDFLEDDFSATITDGITSIIFLDRNCKFIKYESIVKENTIEGCELINCLPIRFAQTITMFTKNNDIGIFLLSNGDIVIAKNQKIEFVKRNGKWSNFSYSSFSNYMSMDLNCLEIKDTLFKEVFSSSLDVSFAHSGGIIAVVDYETRKDKINEVLSKSDDFTIEISDEELQDELKTHGDSYFAIMKKIRKRKIILNLLKNIKEKELNFTFVDRRLRMELISMDGATIIDKKGKIISFGAIIQNDKGSSGGGRGAAAKKLSNYGGFAIKISTDGYIEVYIEGKLRYSIK